MIAPNNNPTTNQPGRNEPCPCGSGRKYKNCCLDDEVKQRMQQELVHLRILVHLLLSQIHKLTRSNRVIVAQDVLLHYPRDAAFNMARDPSSGDFVFWAEVPQEKPVIQPVRRLILPQG